MLDPASASTAEIMDAVENRDKEIMANLVEFIRGLRVRVDVVTPPATKTVGPAAPNEPELAGPPQATLPQQQAGPTPAADLGEPAPVTTEMPVEAGASNGEAISETPGRVDVGGLHVAYAEDPAVRLILDHFASRQRNQNVTEIDALLDALGRAGTPSEKSSLIRAFRRLDALGIGRFLAGRRGHATRFEWSGKSLSVRNLATSGE